MDLLQKEAGHEDRTGVRAALISAFKLEGLPPLPNVLPGLCNWSDHDLQGVNVAIVPLVICDSETGERKVIGKAFVNMETGEVQGEIENPENARLITEDLKYMSIGPFSFKFE